MKDSEIIQLYEERSENAIKETDRKYGRFCSSIAFRILFDKGETEVIKTYKLGYSLPEYTGLQEKFSMLISRRLRKR